MTGSYKDCFSYTGSSFEDFPEFFSMKAFVTFIFILFLKTINAPYAGLAPAESWCEVPVQYLFHPQKGTELHGGKG